MPIGEAEPFWPEPDVMDHLCKDTSGCHIRVLISQAKHPIQRKAAHAGFWLGVIVVGTAEALGIKHDWPWWLYLAVVVPLGVGCLLAVDHRTGGIRNHP